MSIKKKIAFLTLVLAICAMGYSAVQLTKIEQIYQEGNAVYEALGNMVKRTATTATAAFPQQQAGTEAAETSLSSLSPESPAEKKIYIPGIEIDFAALKAINTDAVAWLYSPDTPIDYPVMKADDYSYYLNRMADRTWNVNGSIFIDYNCPPDFSGKLTVLYGHHMKSGGMMFGSLEEYKNQAYYQEHPFMYLYTEPENFRIDILYGFVIGAGQWRDRAFMYDVNLGDLLTYAAHNTTFESGAEYAEGDRIIAMSTCSYDFNDARYVVIGILRGD